MSFLAHRVLMFTAYPDQHRVRCGKKHCVVFLCAIAAVAVVLLGEKAIRTERPINSRQQVHFLQPFLYSPGFEVGLWTWHRGVETTTTAEVVETPVPPEKGRSEIPKDGGKRDVELELSAAEVEVERLRAELVAERQRSALQQEELERISKEALREKEKVARAVELDQQPTKAPSTEPPQVSTPLPTAQKASSDAAQVEGPVRIPSSLFRQPPAPEASKAKPGGDQILPAAAKETDTLNKERPVPTAEAKTEALANAAADVVGNAATTEAPIPPAAQPPAVASAPVVKTPVSEQPTITLKAGGSEIHVKIGETPSVQQQSVQPDTKKEESVAAVTPARSPSEAVVEEGTTTTPPRTREQISSDVATRVEAAPASTSTSTTVASDVAPSSGTAVEASGGTSITLKSQGQTITIQIGSGNNDKKTEIVQPSPAVSVPIQETTDPKLATSVSMDQSQSPSVSKASAPVKAPATVQLPKHVPEPIGTPAPQALSMPSAAVRPSPPEPKSTTPPEAVSTTVATTTTTSTLEITTTSTSLTEDLYANLALRAR